MALIKCKECGNEISTAAKVCPKCGAVPKRTGCFAKFLLMIVGLSVIGAVVNLLPDSKATEPPDGFHAMKWGAPPGKGLKKKMGPTDDGLSMYVLPDGTKPQPLFDVPVAEEAFSYTGNKFYSGNAWLDGRTNFEKMKAALVKVYGQPSVVNEQLHLWTWKWPSSKIEVNLGYQDNFSRTTVTFVNNGI